MRENFSSFHTVSVEKQEILCHWFFFREISYLFKIVTSLAKTLLSRNFCQKSVRRNFSFFHIVAMCRNCGNSVSPFFAKNSVKSSQISPGVLTISIAFLWYVSCRSALLQQVRNRYVNCKWHSASLKYQPLKSCMHIYSKDPNRRGVLN